MRARHRVYALIGRKGCSGARADRPVWIARARADRPVWIAHMVLAAAVAAVAAVAAMAAAPRPTAVAAVMALVLVAKVVVGSFWQW